jgi:hypothetical protein
MQLVLKDRATKSVEGKLSFIDLAGSERGADRGETDVKTRYARLHSTSDIIYDSETYVKISNLFV